ncbi:hypothetical protein [Klugiella xanthotipulae]|nr:hypothetical protein [Klugiella xanthotipulae]
MLVADVAVVEEGIEPRPQLLTLLNQNPSDDNEGGCCGGGSCSL